MNNSNPIKQRRKDQYELNNFTKVSAKKIKYRQEIENASFAGQKKRHLKSVRNELDLDESIALRDIRVDIIEMRDQLNNAEFNSDICHLSSRRVSRLNEAIRMYERVKGFKNPISLLLTFRGNDKDIIDEIQEAFSTFHNRVSKRVNKLAYKRRKKLINCVAVAEYDDNTRPHIHAIFDIPFNFTKEKLLEDIQYVTNRTFNLSQKKKDYGKPVKIEESIFNSTERSVSYLIKEETKDKRIEFSDFFLA